jgi:O-antigen/teichoic acid export membrane protein
VPWTLVWPCGLILFLEHVANDANDLLIARHRAMLSSVLLFVRSGLWPLAVIVWGALDPAARTLECLLAGWIGGLVILWLVLGAHALVNDRWRFIRLRWRWLLSGVPASWPFYIKDLTAAASLHLDRFLISMFLGLELTGVYTLFWSITNVAHNLAVYTVVHPQLPTLIATHASRDNGAFHATERRVRNESIAWAVALAVGAAIAVPILLPYLDRPALQTNLLTFWIILIATLLRAAADTYGFFLLVLRRDHAIAVISVAGALGSAALNVLLIPLFGLPGAALAYMLTGAGLLAARVWIASDGKARLATPSPQPAKS